MIVLSPTHWLTGELTDSERVWSAALPALAVLSYGLIAGMIYLAQSWLRGPLRDPELDAHGPGGLTTRGLAEFFSWTMRPWCGLLARVRFPPSALTTLSFVLGLGAGIAVAAGRFALGGWLFVASGALDFLDGRVARMTGRTTVAGAALDSVLDRYVEGVLIAGLSWYYRHDWVLMACLVALTGSLLVPYVRARGESLGLKMNDVGFMQRPERIIALGLGTALSPILEVWLEPNTNVHPPHRLAIGALVLIAVSSHFTTVQRLVRILRSTAQSTPEHWQAIPPLPIVVATAVDFALTSGFFYFLARRPVIATALGCIGGALASWTLLRVVASFSAERAAAPHLGRYAFMFATSLALNSGGVALVLTLNLPFIMAWSLTRAVVFVMWSYPLHRDFVFQTALSEPARPAPLRELRSPRALVLASQRSAARRKRSATSAGSR